MPENAIIFEIKDRIALITLNRPENRNSMDYLLLPAFEKCIQQVKKNKDLRCIIITGTGKSFCAGADFKSNIFGTEDKLPNEIFMDFYRPFLLIQEIEIPVIAAMNGHAIGGGFGLALICDIRIANNNAKYGANFARLGIHPGMAVTYMLPRIIGLPRAMELLFTGRLINGKESEKIGLVNYSVKEEDVLEKAMELAQEIASCAPTAVKMIKRSVFRGLDWNPAFAAEFEAHCQSRTFEMKDAKEGILALLEKRKPDFCGV